MLDFPPAENLFETKQNIWFNYFHALCKEQQKSLVLKKRKTNSINHANIPAFCLRKVKHKWRMLLLSWKDWNCGLLRYWNLLVREKGSGRQLCMWEGKSRKIPNVDIHSFMVKYWNISGQYLRWKHRKTKWNAKYI